MGRAKPHLALGPPAWMELAAYACHSDPDLWFPDGDPCREAEAVAICRQECTVSVGCLAYALGNKTESGVWGGTPEDERRQVRDKPAVAS